MEKILKRDPQDLPARLLLAVHLMDIGRLEEADRQFDTALASSPEDLQQAFASSEWTAPRAAVAKFASLSAEDRTAYDQGYWAYYDPTPLTLMNENRLEIWKRLAIAEFLFGKPEKGVRGWQTDPGETLVRFGAPVSHMFDPGAVVAGPEPDQTLPHAGLGWDLAATKATLHFTPPALAWGYSFRGLDFSLLFSDLNLNGNFYVDDWSAKTLDVLRRATPVIFHEVPPGTIRYLYLASGGVAGPAGGVQQAVELGVPLWRHPQARDWLDRVRVDIVVRDSTRTPVKRSLRKASRGDVYPMLPDLDVLLVSAEYDLRPGNYTVTAFVEDEESKEHGEFTVPIQARDFAGESQALVLSDLKVTLGASKDSPGPKVTKLGRTFVPNPMCLVGDDRNLEVFYELYGLSLRGGQAQCQVRYTVLPRAYVLGFEHHVREGRVPAASMVTFAADGVKAGGSQLDLGNYADMQFPEETFAVENGRAAKGVVLRLASLEPGEYALVVTATDMLSQATATARTFFRILTDVQLRELMAYTQQ